MKRTLVLLLAVVFASTLLVAQSQPAPRQRPPATPEEKAKRPSPPGTAEFTFADGKKVTIDYSRPVMKGREIYGALVPYGKVWRTGANEATSLKTDTDLIIGGTKVPAGSYALYTLPAESGWKLIINKQTGQWGTVYDEKQDLARVDMTTTKLPSPVEQFTIAITKEGKDAMLNLDWANTRASVPVAEAK